MGSGSFIEDVIYLDIVIGIVGSMVIFLYYRNNIEFSIKVILLLGKRVWILMYYLFIKYKIIFYFKCWIVIDV